MEQDMSPNEVRHMCHFCDAVMSLRHNSIDDSDHYWECNVCGHMEAFDVIAWLREHDRLDICSECLGTPTTICYTCGRKGKAAP